MTTAAKPDPVPTGEPPAKPGMRISFAAVGDSQAKPPPRSPYVLPAIPPGVVPPRAPTMAQDDAFSALYGFANAQPGLGEGLTFPGFPLLAELSQRPEYRHMTETIAREMTRKWCKLETAGKEADKSDRLAAIETEFQRLDVRARFRTAAEHDGFFGRGHLYLDTGASDDPAELATPLPLSPTKIRKRGLLRLTAVEPLWTYPAAYNSTAPLKPDYYEPQAWYVMGKTVHISRFLTFVSRELPDILKPAYSFAGLSLSQMAQPYVENWIRTRQSVGDLVHSFSVSGLKTNLAATLAGATNNQPLQARAALFNNNRDNSGMMLIDKETEEFFNVSTPLGGLDHLQAQAQEQMASVSSIPLVKLLGITPSGLNATSEDEIRVFYDFILALQEHLFSPQLTRLLQIVQLSLWGEVDPDITFRWEPLWQIGEDMRATVRKTEADTDIAYINASVLSPLEARTRLAADEGSPYAGLDVDDLPEPPDAPEGPPEDGEQPDADADPGTQPPRPANDPGAPRPKPAAVAGDAADWKESDHKRDDGGKFSGTGGGGTKGAAKAKAKGAGKSEGSAAPDPHGTLTFTGANKQHGVSALHGVPLAKWSDHPTSTAGWASVAGQNPDIAEPPLPKVPGKKLASGVIIREPDGRVWLVKPTGEYGGYKHTFPKGGVEKGLSPQANAIKEAYEESGLKVRITGFAGDFERDTSVGRYYYAERVGGDPARHGWESEAVVLAPPAALDGLLNRKVDRAIAAAHAGAQGQPGPPAPASAAPADPGTPIDTAGWTKTGKQLGSNPGGKYTDPAGGEWYGKQSKSADHARNEVLAGKLYKAAGSPVVEPHLADFGGKLGTVTRWAPGAVPITKAQADQDDAARHFATHAWLANWDAAGLDYDNQARVGGDMTTMDVGGALNYRAQGQPKGAAFGPSAGEWDTLRDPAINLQNANVFGKMTPAQLRDSAARVAAVSDHSIRQLVHAHGPGDHAAKQALADKLIARRDDIAARGREAGKLGKDAMPGKFAPRFAADDAQWKEADHKRDKGGKFAKTASIADPPNWIGAMGKKVKAAAEQGLAQGHAPHDIAAKIHAAAATHTHPHSSTYANNVLAQLEAVHGLKPGVLGKAAPKGKPSVPPQPMSGSAPPPPPPPPPQAAKPAPPPKPAKPVSTPVSEIVDGPEPHPDSKPQQEVYALAIGPQPNAEKVKLIEAKKADMYKGGFAEKFADEWIKALGGPTPPAAPSATAPAAPAAGKAISSLTPHGAVVRGSLRAGKRRDKLLALEKGAIKLASTKAKGSTKVCPSLDQSFWDAVPPKTKTHFQQYADGYYDEMNGALRTGSASGSVAEKLADMDELYEHDAAELTEDVILTRGEDTPQETIDAWIKALNNGIPARYMRTGFTSTSMATTPAFQHKKVWFHMTVRKGQRALGVDTISPHTENEVLLNHGLGFEIYEISEHGGKVHVMMTSI